MSVRTPAASSFCREDLLPIYLSVPILIHSSFLPASLGPKLEFAKEQAIMKRSILMS